MEISGGILGATMPGQKSKSISNSIGPDITGLFHLYTLAAKAW